MVRATVRPPACSAKPRTPPMAHWAVIEPRRRWNPGPRPSRFHAWSSSGLAQTGVSHRRYGRPAGRTAIVPHRSVLADVMWPGVVVVTRGPASLEPFGRGASDRVGFVRVELTEHEHAIAMVTMAGMSRGRWRLPVARNVPVAGSKISASAATAGATPSAGHDRRRPRARSRPTGSRPRACTAPRPSDRRARSSRRRVVDLGRRRRSGTSAEPRVLRDEPPASRTRPSPNSVAVWKPPRPTVMVRSARRYRGRVVELGRRCRRPRHRRRRGRARRPEVALAPMLRGRVIEPPGENVPVAGSNSSVVANAS